MNPIPEALAARLEALKLKGVIAGWKDGGGPNYGRGERPLPAIIFPATEGPATTYYSLTSIANAIRALELFGPLGLFNQNHPAVSA